LTRRGRRSGRVEKTLKRKASGYTKGRGGKEVKEKSISTKKSDMPYSKGATASLKKESRPPCSHKKKCFSGKGEKTKFA